MKYGKLIYEYCHCDPRSNDPYRKGQLHDKIYPVVIPDIRMMEVLGAIFAKLGLKLIWFR